MDKSFQRVELNETLNSTKALVKVRKDNLIKIVGKIFDHEYSSSNITQVKENRKAKGAFSIDLPNLHLSTDCSQMIFRELESFIVKQNQSHP